MDKSDDTRIKNNFNHVTNYFRNLERKEDKSLNVSDINGKPKKFMTKRVVNPLEPQYQVPTHSGRAVRQIGHIEGSQPGLRTAVRASPDSVNNAYSHPSQNYLQKMAQM